MLLELDTSYISWYHVIYTFMYTFKVMNKANESPLGRFERVSRDLRGEILENDLTTDRIG